ncbi:MAG: T9SS type A sorting domain-containing protein [Flavobacteriales bacterium]|nr:MAG: T9SS type A sorting domain-containing protein [Flavobacteriales bacterium]
MKRTLRNGALAFGVLAAGAVTAQTRYIDEVFTDAEITVTSNVIYGTNIDFLRSVFTQPAIYGPEIVQLQTLVSTQQPIPADFYSPDTNLTKVKVTDLRMDVYQPDQGVDTVAARPVILYLHTGNLLPPPFNGSPNGLRTDSCAVVACQKLAKRGYVAISVSYRGGWNPLGATVQVRRGTLLNAVYRAIHDVKQCTRTLRADAAGSNLYAINPDKLTVWGEGTGGYIALADATMDDPAELFVPKFRPNPFDPTISYIDTNLVGNLEGLNGQLALYRDNGFSTEVNMCVNMGGALADTTWLEQGDVPMVSMHTVRDDFAPFEYGLVIVPTTNEEVVDVPGPNKFIPLAVSYGNNASFENLSNDPITAAARALYGTTWDRFGDGGAPTTVTIANAEGLYPFVRDLRPWKANEASPWQWWDQSSILAQQIVDPGPPPVTANQASLLSNPDMTSAKGRAYLDTCIGYAAPRIVCALQLGPCALGTPDCLGVIDGPDVPGQPCDDGNANTVNDSWTVNCDCIGQPIGINEPAAAAALVLAPNPAQDVLRISSPAGKVLGYTVHATDGRLIHNASVNTNSIMLERGNLESGSYFITLQFADGRAVRRVVFN